MEDLYAPPEQGKYGSGTMRRQLADGVYMITANALIKVVLVAQKLADRLLSAAAHKYGEREGDYLRFPGDKAAIPLYELAQKGKIRLFDEQVRQHFGSLIRQFPDYLRERGSLARQPAETMSGKVWRELAAFQDTLARQDKQTIMGQAQGIAERQQLAAYLSQAEIGRAQLGLLLTKENLLNTVYNKTLQVTRPLTSEHMAEALALVKSEAARHPEAARDRLEAFRRELQAAQASRAEAVALQLQGPDGVCAFAVSMAAFQATLDPAMLARFAEIEMLDFPSPDFYGDGNADLWKALVQKRFSENLKSNFEQYAAQGGNGYSLTVVQELTKAPPENQFDGFMKRVQLARYVAGNTENPDECLKEIKPYCKSCADMIRDVQAMAAESPQPAAQAAEAELEDFAAEHI